ncbi:MAG: DUF5658 family protein [Acidimicrobiia bacterium]
MRGRTVGLGQLAWSGRVPDAELPQFRRGAAALALALVALNILDYTVTNFTIQNLGAVELNPLFAPLIGTPWALVAKIGLPMAVVLMATAVRSAKVLPLLRVVIAIYLGVAIFGLGQIALALR